MDGWNFIRTFRWGDVIHRKILRLAFWSVDFVNWVWGDVILFIWNCCCHFAGWVWGDVILTHAKEISHSNFFFFFFDAHRNWNFGLGIKYSLMRRYKGCLWKIFGRFKNFCTYVWVWWSHGRGSWVAVSCLRKERESLLS